MGHGILVFRRNRVAWLGAVILAVNIGVAALSLTDMYLLASGAVRVGLPSEKDFNWHFDPARTAVVFRGNYSVVNNGFYDITDLVIDATVSTGSGVKLVNYRKYEPRIPAFGGGRYPITAELPVDHLLQLDYGSVLFNTTHLFIRVRVDAIYEFGLARFHSDQTLEYKWHPPLEDYSKLLLGGNLSQMLQENLTLLRDNPGVLEAFAASAILANGTTVILRTNESDVYFRVNGTELRIEVFNQKIPPEKQYEFAIPLRTGGGG
jgi:hypothetical protein